MTKEKILILDSTLRDGEQAPGAAMTPAQKVKIGCSLADLGVDVLEAGFAASSSTDAQVIYRLSQLLPQRGVVVETLARCCPSDVQIAAQALAPAIHQNAGQIRTFISTSDMHIKYKMQTTREEILKMIDASIRYAKTFTDNVGWAGEDSSRADVNFLAECVKTALAAGAKTIALCDTIGILVDTQMQELMEQVRALVKAPDDIIFSVHCHNDKGLATANSLFGLKGGARQVECCINGLGERAGNAALEEIVMAIQSGPDRYPFTTNIKTDKLQAVSRMVAKFSGIPVCPNKAVVGSLAFSHASGIHQDGLIKAWKMNLDNMYGAINASDVGAKDKIVITRHSGVSGVLYVLQQQGLNPTDAEAHEVLRRVKNHRSGTKIFDSQKIVEMYRDVQGEFSQKAIILDKN
ncbi:MAG: 2-isopropylmalate synthase [Alphaproteobacteria bacterium]|nr:2-isopropylmalate synthase [Alphaproteobacteria bacterium]